MKMSQEELNEILRKHKLWLEDRPYGEWADLRGADLRNAYLQYANLQSANLQSADLQSADLRNAYLQYANLWDVDLRNANLQSANLQSADLRNAYLQSADLQSADLQSADLQSADLQSADLRNADLRNADLRNANLPDNINTIMPLACPSEGAFIGWKKCINGNTFDKTAIVKLLIPADALRSSATSRKCRASEAKVLEISDMLGTPCSKAFSAHDHTFEYIVGEIVKPTIDFNTDRWNECAPGIHFFITREEAENYDL